MGFSSLHHYDPILYASKWSGIVHLQRNIDCHDFIEEPYNITWVASTYRNCYGTADGPEKVHEGAGSSYFTTPTVVYAAECPFSPTYNCTLRPCSEKDYVESIPNAKNSKNVELNVLIPQAECDETHVQYFPICSFLSALIVHTFSVLGELSSQRKLILDLVLAQIEYYFSTDNLLKDTFLRQHMTEGGWVPIALVATFPRIRWITNDMSIIRNAFGTSYAVELQGDSIRKKDDWQRWILRPADPPKGVLKNNNVSDEVLKLISVWRNKSFRYKKYSFKLPVPFSTFQFDQVDNTDSESDSIDSVNSDDWGMDEADRLAYEKYMKS